MGSNAPIDRGPGRVGKWPVITRQLHGRAMNFRRSDFDVTNRINVTDPVCVKLEIVRIYKSLYAVGEPVAISRAFDDAVALYRGLFPGYSRCDTEYHDLQHALEVTLAMARLLDGYERSRVEGPAIGARLFELGVVCALYHDIGYIRRANDTRHTNGAEYTPIHVSRGGRFLRDYLPKLGMEEFADVAGAILHFTGYETPVSEIRVPDPIYRLVGTLLGSADIIGQMSDRCYLEKCRDRLYPEFVAGGITVRRTEAGEEVVFASGEDLLRKTPGFYKNASKRLDVDLGGAYQYAQAHFGGPNLYMDAVQQNIRFVEKKTSSGGEIVLRRNPPVTCVRD